MTACAMRPDDKKAFIGAVGQDLVRARGKQKYYKPKDIRTSAERSGYSVDCACWAYSFYSTPEDFKAVHDALGEVCDYAAMKGEVLADLASSTGFSILDIDLSWIDLPDIDLGSLFDWVDW